MRRRDLLAVVGTSTFALPPTAHGQAMPVIGFLNAASRTAYERSLIAFHQGLATSRYVEGRNVAIEYRWAEGRYEQLPIFIADLVQRKVDILVATSTPAAFAAKKANLPIPVVFTTSGDPVELHLVDSLSRPGGNLTGASQLNVEVAPKRLELVREMMPKAIDVGLLVNPQSPVAKAVSGELEEASAKLGFKLLVLQASTDRELSSAFETAAQRKVEAIVIGTDTFFNDRIAEMAALGLRYRIATIYQYPEFTSAGGLVSMGGSRDESYRLAGVYTGRILAGQKPADLPVQQVTRIELSINQKTARAIGVTIPTSMTDRADEILE